MTFTNKLNTSVCEYKDLPYELWIHVFEHLDYNTVKEIYSIDNRY